MRAAACLAIGLLCLDAGSIAADARPASRVAFTGGDGRTCEAAVLIKGARNTAEGAQAQKRWIAEHAPGARRTGSAITRREDRIYEVISLAGAGEPGICFDVTEFFGSW